jgi:hypothetical protein
LSSATIPSDEVRLGRNGENIIEGGETRGPSKPRSKLEGNLGGNPGVDKNEDAEASEFPKVQQDSTPSAHVIETEYIENRRFSA